KPSPMSAANRTPPSAHARNAVQVIRRRVTSSATADTQTPTHNRHMAKVGPDRSLHLTNTGPHAQMNVASQTAPTPRRWSRSSVIRPCSQRGRARYPGSMREHTGTSLVVAAVSTFAFTIWAAVIAVMLWSGITIYAIVKWIGSPQDHASATTLLVLLVGTVALFPLLLAIAIYLISKPMRYARKRARKESEQLSLPIADATAD